MLRIYRAPDAFSFGPLDRFNAKMERAMNNSGISCVVKVIWSDFLARRLFFSRLPYGYKVYRECNLAFSIPWKWVPYDASKEAEYAAGAVAGLAPLENTVYNSCKGNYKVKTYMALGVPIVASLVGYNQRLIRHGETGFLVKSESEWEEALRTLIADPVLAAKIGAAARADAVKRYSYSALMPVWAEALRMVFADRLMEPCERVNTPNLP